MFACNPVRLSLESIKGNLFTYFLLLQAVLIGTYKVCDKNLVHWAYFQTI